jgi:hypothetical protein
VTVSGGSLVITNITGKARIGGDDASVTSRLEVTSGFLGLYATRHDSFAIGKDGVLSMTGGRAEYYCAQGNNYWKFRMVDGGILDLSDNAEFDILMSGNPAPIFGTGVVNIRENALLKLRKVGDASWSRWTPAAANETLTVNLSGNATLDEASCDLGAIAGMWDGSKTVVNASGNSVLSGARLLFVGYGTAAGASGELNISDNAVVSNSMHYGIFVGKNGTAAKPAVGRIKMTGGLLRAYTSINAGELGALNFGCDTATGFAGFYNYGTLELSGGSVTNVGSTYNKLIVGAGNGYGEVLQSGGIFSQGTGDAKIGWRGGTGLYRFTGGTADFSKCDFIVGADSGKGTLEIGAGSGTLTSKNLNLAGSDATLKFKVGADGELATLGVTGMFTVASGAKLVVDASEYTGKGPVTLMTFAGKDGDFADEDITLLVSKSGYHLKRSSGKIELSREAGLTIVFK